MVSIQCVYNGFSRIHFFGLLRGVREHAISGLMSWDMIYFLTVFENCVCCSRFFNIMVAPVSPWSARTVWEFAGIFCCPV
jgi:hypothetical protein